MDTEEPKAAAVEPAGDQPFKTLADNAPDIIARYDQDLRYLYVNPGIEVLSGIPPREFIGKTDRELGMPEKLEEFWSRTFRGVFQTGRTTTIEFDFPTPKGVRSFQTLVAPELGPDGAVATLVAVTRDITPHKRLEAELRERDRAYRTLADCAPDLIVRFDREFRHLYVNPKVEAISGIPAGEFIGKTNQELGMPAALDAQWLAVFREVLATGRTREIEFEFPTPKGVRSFQARIAPEFAPNGTVQSLVCVTRDITRRKQAEEALAKARGDLEQKVRERTAELAETVGKLQEEIRNRQAAEKTLRESEDKYRALVERTNDVMYATDAEGRITYISPQVERYGLSAGRVMGRSFLELVSPVDRDAAALDYQKTMETGQEIPTTFRFVDGYGRQHWMEDQGKVRRDDDGRVLGLIGMVREVTDRKQAENALRASEERNRALLNAIPDLMFLLDREGRFIDFHSVAVASLYVIPSQFLGKRVTEVLPPAVADLVMAQLARLVAVGEVITFEYELPAGSESRWYEANATLCGADSILVIARDITERRETELRLRETNTVLEQRTCQLRALASELTLAEQRERRRLAEVLHDHLQQLLVGASLRLPFLEHATEPAMQQVAGEIHSLIDQALECSRSLTGELSPPILHQGGLVPALKWLAGWMQEKHRLTVVLHADRDATPTTEDLTVLLFQSIRELLFNAAKYAKVQAVTVEVRRLANWVKAEVVDTGSGFDPAELRAAGGSASGFGLLGIRERLDLMGGRMEVESAPGQGSRFTLWVPVGGPVPGETVTEVAMAPAGDSPVPAGRGGEPGTTEQKIRVLLVDDHSVVRQALAHLLDEAADIEVIGEAPDGQTAIDLVQKLLPDVVTMDISMPGMNGIEATRRIHAEFPAVRVIGLSMFSADERAEEMHRAGAAAYLTKSGPADALLAAIRDRGNKATSECLKHGRSTCAITRPGDVKAGRRSGKGPRPASDDRARTK